MGYHNSFGFITNGHRLQFQFWTIFPVKLFVMSRRVEETKIVNRLI